VRSKARAISASGEQELQASGASCTNARGDRDQGGVGEFGDAWSGTARS
jgi:hypothetical protein